MNFMKYDYPQNRIPSNLTPLYRGNSYIYYNNDMKQIQEVPVDKIQ